MNFNKFGRKVLLGLVSLVVVLSCVKLGARAEGETGILYLNNEPITSFRQDGNYTYPTKLGYVFGGWYNDAEGKDPMTEEEANNATTAYVKWVPDYVLSVKAQVNKAALDDNITTTSKAAIRLLTSVDSRDYKSVGFDVVRGDYPSYTYHLDSKNVYTRVRVVGETEGTYTDHTPEDVFGSDSHFFEAATFKNMPETAVNTELKATPYWVTLDGTTVQGTYSIKTVNLGRSWVYVNEYANADEKKFGTHEHPFTDLSDALDAVLLENNGKVIVNGNSTITVSSDFAWEKLEKTRNIAIVGENKETSKLNFSAMTKLNLYDGVTFDNMTLTLPQTVFANGHGFKIKDNVVSENAKTSIYGGSEGTSTKGATVTETNVEVYAGSYKEVWGGGKYCTITNDIHVTIKNANIYDSTGGDKSRVFGSGANDTVKGDIFVTIGGTFNATQKVAEFERSDHSRYSSVHGAGSGTVQGNTYVRIEDQAEVDYVYGGGGSSSEVKGTCYVELKGGTVFSIYGGGKGDNSTSAGKNADTSVIVTGGKVCQIIGGNGNSMIGNSYVEIAGGQVTRRIYGGCYNDIFKGVDKHYVTGYSTVVIKDETAVAGLSGDDAGITAGSRSTKENSDEKAVLICNNNSYTNLKNKLDTSYNEYDYLIQANAGGMVSSVGTRLSITPDATNNAIVRLDDSVNGTLHAYMTSKGMSVLPELDASTGKRAMYVVFGTEQLDPDTVGNYEAKVGGTHFDTLENAIAEAKELSDAGETEDGKVTVTLLKDVEIDTVLSVGGAYDIILQSETDNKYSITTSNTNDNVITVNGTLTMNNIDVKGGKHGVYVGSSGKLYSTEADNIKGVSISNTASRGLFVDGGTVKLYNLTVSGTTLQALFFDKEAEASISEFSVTGKSGQVAVRIMGGADLTLNGGTIYANTGYGIYMDEASSKVNAVDTKVIRATGENALIGVKHATAQLTFDQSKTGEAYIDGNSKEGIGVNIEKGSFVLNGGTIRNNSATSGAGVTVQKDATFIMNGGTISNNTATEYGAGVCAVGSFAMNGGEISNNTATTQGGGVYVNESTFTMKGGSVYDNTAKYGGGVYVPASSIFTMQGGTISANTATNAGTTDATRDSGGGVYVEAGATFNMNTPAEGATAGVITANIAQMNQFGAGVLVKGTFNMNAGTISNHGSESNPLAVEGTGVCISGDSAVFTMNGGEISNNYAANKAGAGVSLRDGKPAFTMNGGKITANHTTGNVGGMVIRGAATFTMNEGAIISDNTAGTGKVGGGISMDGTATFVLNGGTFSGNTTGNVNNDINLASGSAHIKLSKQLANNIYVSHHKSAYEATIQVAAKHNDISDKHFQSSMKYIVMQQKGTSNWFVADNGNGIGYLTKAVKVDSSSGECTYYDDLASAISEATEGSTINIYNNAEISSTIAIAQSLTFNSDRAVAITASDSLAGHMFNVTGGTLTIEGISETEKISLIAGTGTQSVVYNNGGESVLTNVEIIGDANTTASDQANGIYNKGGTFTAKSVTIHDVKNSGIVVSANASVNLDNVQILNIGYRGIDSSGTITVTNTINPVQALFIKNTGNHGIFIQRGSITAQCENVPADADGNPQYAVQIDTVTGTNCNGLRVGLGTNSTATASAEMQSLRVYDTKGQGVYFAGKNNNIKANGTISDFIIEKTGSAAVRPNGYSDLMLTNGTIMTNTYCIATNTTDILTTSNVKVKTTGSVEALSIQGTKKGDEIIILE